MTTAVATVLEDYGAIADMQSSGKTGDLVGGANSIGSWYAFPTMTVRKEPVDSWEEIESPTQFTCLILFQDDAKVSEHCLGLANRINVPSPLRTPDSVTLTRVIEIEEDIVVRISPNDLREVRLRIVERFVGKPNSIL